VPGSGRPVAAEELATNVGIVHSEALSDFRRSMRARYSYCEPRMSLNALEIVHASSATAMKLLIEKPKGTSIMDSMRLGCCVTLARYLLSLPLPLELFQRLTGEMLHPI
jgi:hypothetical protein